MSNHLEWGGGAWGMVYEGVAVLPTLGRLKTRPVHISLSSDSTTITPLRSTAAGAGLMGWGADVAEVEGATGVDVPSPTAAALRLASRSANFFFLSLLKLISTHRQQVNTGNKRRGETVSESKMKEEVWEPGNTNICLKTFWAKLMLEQLQSAEGSWESREELAYPPLLRG